MNDNSRWMFMPTLPDLSRAHDARVGVISDLGLLRVDMLH